MGEFADMTIDQSFDFEESSDDNGFDDDLPGGGFSFHSRRRSLSKTCNRCGQAGLRWGLTKEQKFRLFDGKTVHVCAKSKETNNQLEFL